MNDTVLGQNLVNQNVRQSYQRAENMHDLTVSKALPTCIVRQHVGSNSLI